MDIFETRKMLRVIEHMLPVPSFFRDTFFTEETHNTRYIDTDIVKDGEQMAAFVLPSEQAKTVDGMGYSTQSYKAPYIKEKTITTAQNLLARQPGQHIYAENSNPMQNAAKKIGKDTRILMNRVDRRIEYMCAELMNAGTVTVENGDTLDYSMPSAHKITLTGTDLWTNADSSPFSNWQDWQDLLSKNGHLPPDTIVMGLNAYKAWMKHDETTGNKSLFDKTKIILGQINPRMLPKGVRYAGYLLDIGCDVYVYNGIVKNDNNQTIDLMPKNKVFMGSTRARSIVHFGAIEDLKAGGVAQAKYFPKSWEQEDPSVRFLSLQSAPLPVLHEPAAFLSAVVV